LEWLPPELPPLEQLLPERPVPVELKFERPPVLAVFECPELE
jgi:hypothetical protein